MRPIDINFSNWDNLLEEKSGKYCALRLGFRQIRGLREEDMKLLTSHRIKLFKTIDEIRDLNLSQAALEKLADADAFRSIGLDRRQALWELSTCNDRPIALFKGQVNENATEETVSLPKMSLSEHVVHDYAATSLSIKAHPVSFVREKLHQLHILSAKELSAMSDGDQVKVAGLVLVRQRPGTAKGVCFITIEDETGCANLVVYENLFQKFRKQILQSRLLMVQGKLQREGEVIHVIVKDCYDLSKLLRHLTANREENPPVLTLSHADVKKSAVYPLKSKGTENFKEKIFPGGRNFR
jgi:error-prone DNA polymerase